MLLVATLGEFSQATVKLGSMFTNKWEPHHILNTLSVPFGSKRGIAACSCVSFVGLLKQNPVWNQNKIRRTIPIYIEPVVSRCTSGIRLSNMHRAEEAGNPFLELILIQKSALKKVSSVKVSLKQWPAFKLWGLRDYMFSRKNQV